MTWFGASALALGGSLIGDEWVHWRQIERFVRGDYRVFGDALTNIPGYHWLVTAILAPFSNDSLWAVRAVTAVMTAASALIFHRVRLRIHPADVQRATAQYFFLPPMFIYGYLGYTDVPAVMFLLGALLATLNGRHRLSALLMLCAMSIRQNTVLWVVFLSIYAAWPLLITVVAPATRQRWQPADWKHWGAELFGLVWPYLFAVACFLVYWAWNGSISYSAVQGRTAHPDFRPDIGNPIYMLAVAGVMFPFQVAAGWRRLAAFGSSWKRAWVWLMPFVVFGLYALLFEVHHPYNLGTTNLRNQWLHLVAQGGVAWWLFGGLAAWGFCGLVFQRYPTPQAWLWLPFSLLFVGASWLIETRYAIVPFVLFLALRRPGGRWAERLTLAGWIVLSGWLAWNGFNQSFMW